jgi:serine/threonine-protein kinase
MADTSRLGRYQIRREIARSNDIVYEATDTLIGRRVALKELALPPNLVGQAKRERVERFYREARAAGALSHKNIVTVFEVGEDHGRHFIAMEFLEGQSLRQILDLNGGLPLNQIRDVLLQTLDALAYAHANGVVHRDVKPDNLYLLPDGTVKLTDFGIARIMDEPSLTGAGQVFGTPSYMSPEQIAGKPADERTDLYSLGVMAYEMAAGRKPFVGENVVALTYQILNVRPDPPRGADAALSETIARAMAKEPSERFQSARQMSDALRNPSGGITGSWAAVTTGISPPGGAPAFGDPLATPIGTGLAAPVPTLPPAAVRHRPHFKLTGEMRRFLLALAGGLSLGTLVVGLTLGIKGAYKNYAQAAAERAAMSVYRNGVRDYQSGRYLDAVRDFGRVVRDAGGTSLAKNAAHAIVQSYLNLGDVEMGRNLQQAYHYYSLAIPYEPNNPETYLRIGDVLQRMGHFDDAIRVWQKAQDLGGFGDFGLTARHAQAQAWYNRAVGEFNAGNRDLARNYWQNAIEADPGGPYSAQAEEKIRLYFNQPYPGY